MSKADQSIHMNYSQSTQSEEMTKVKNGNLKISPYNDMYKSCLHFELNDVIKICSLILEKIVQYDQTYKKQSAGIFSKYSQFESDEFPAVISIYDYLNRVASYIKCEKNILILSMMNMDKFLDLNKDFVLTKLNCYKLLFMCVMETNKYYDDSYITNKTYSVIGGIEIYDLLLLEIEFQSKILWRMSIDEEKFYDYSKKLETIFY